MNPLPSRLDSVLIQDASKALIKYERNRIQQGPDRTLIEDRPKWVLLQVQLQKEIPKDTRKPIRVKIPHTLFSRELDHSICLFIRDEQKDAVSSYLESKPIAGLTNVMTIGDVHKYCKEFKHRKELLSQHDFFVSHHSIGRQLYNLLGKDFGARNHFPIQISFPSMDQLPGAVQRVVDATYMHLAGRNMTIKVGLTSMSPQEIRENVIQGMEFAVQKLSRGWKEIHSLHLKTKDSGSLPIFSATDNELLNYVRAKVQEKSQLGIEVKDEQSNKSVESSVAVTSPAKEVAKGKRKAKTTVEAPSSVVSANKKTRTTKA
jgi:ribosome biogenesis protein UTP30